MYVATGGPAFSLICRDGHIHEPNSLEPKHGPCGQPEPRKAMGLGAVSFWSGVGLDAWAKLVVFRGSTGPPLITEEPG